MNESCRAVFEYHMNRETVRICTSIVSFSGITIQYCLDGTTSDVGCIASSFSWFPSCWKAFFYPKSVFIKPRPASDIGLVHKVACSSRFFLILQNFDRYIDTIVEQSGGTIDRAKLINVNGESYSSVSLTVFNEDVLSFSKQCC